MSRLFLVLGATSAFFGVTLGAFAAHALRQQLDPRMLEVFHTGVTYQMWHALALILVAMLLHSFPTSRLLIGSGSAFALGILLFSGSLYALSLSGLGVIGVVTPIGGVAFLSGWVLLIIFALRT
jgi:uncharacterized membrane protein YgdD (TMEM256/DUF423 family)